MPCNNYVCLPFSRFDYDTDDWDCWRNDTLDLISDFLNRSKTHTEYENTVAKLVKNKKELMDLDVENTDYLMGGFVASLE